MRRTLRHIFAAILALALTGPGAVGARAADTNNLVGKYFDPQNRNLYTFMMTIAGGDGAKRALVGFPVVAGIDPHYATFNSAAEWNKFVALWRDARAQPRAGVSPTISMLASGHYPDGNDDNAMTLFIGIDPQGSIRFEIGRPREPDTTWWGASLRREDEAAFDTGIAEVSAFFAGH